MRGLGLTATPSMRRFRQARFATFVARYCSKHSRVSRAERHAGANRQRESSVEVIYGQERGLRLTSWIGS